MADERIGLIGPGRMGLAMVKHLTKTASPPDWTAKAARR